VGGEITQRVVGSLLVVLDHPPVGGLAHVLEGGEQMWVEQLIAVGMVEPLDIGILVELAGLDVADGHPGLLDPSGEDLAEELRPVVVAKHLR